MKQIDNDISDSSLLSRLADGNIDAFELIYHKYASPLYRYAFSRIHNHEDAEEVVQEIFLWLCEKREHLDHVTALKSYLYSAVRHRVADRIAHNTIREKYAQHFYLFEKQSDNATEEYMNLSDMQAVIERTISTLPENQQIAFRLSRIEHLPIAVIAERMNLSTGTVENYISHALKHLRGKV